MTSPKIIQCVTILSLSVLLLAGCGSAATPATSTAQPSENPTQGLLATATVAPATSDVLPTEVSPPSATPPADTPPVGGAAIDTTPTTDTPPSTIVAPSVPPPPEGWVSHTDALCAAQYNVPADWHILAPPNTPDVLIGTTSLLSEAPTEPGGGAPHAGVKVEITCMPPDFVSVDLSQDPASVVQAFIAHEDSSGLPTPVRGPLEALTLNGQPAFRYDVQGMGLPTQVYYIIPQNTTKPRLMLVSISPRDTLPEVVTPLIESIHILE